MAKPKRIRDKESLELQVPGYGYRQQQLIWNSLYTTEQQASMTAQCRELIDNGSVSMNK